ncbi:hypothetical protein ACS0TY_020337 [Phlomoides rotata]
MFPWERENKMKPLKLQDFLYGLKWDEKVDTLFAEVLSDQTTMGNFSNDGGDNITAIKTTQYVINKSFKKAFGLRTCTSQTKKLKKRHRVFSWLLSVEGFHYDETTKRTHASTEIWRSVTEVEVFAHAYEVYGDPCWEYLKIIFGVPPVVAPHHISGDMQREVINIPSDDDDTKQNVNHSNPNEVVQVDSSSYGTRGTSYWNNVARYTDDMIDYETSPSINTEASTSNPNGNNIWRPWN